MTGVELLSSESVRRTIGDLWEFLVRVTDEDGHAQSSTPVITVTPPAGGTSTPTVEELGIGVYRAAYTIAAAGRHTATVTATGYGLATATAWGEATAGTVPNLADVTSYLTGIGQSYEEVDVTQALAAELAAQHSACRIPAEYPADLAEALRRRVARNLTMRTLTLAVQQTETDIAVLPGNDPEVRRLERPWRKLVIG